MHFGQQISQYARPAAEDACSQLWSSVLFMFLSCQTRKHVTSNKAGLGSLSTCMCLLPLQLPRKPVARRQNTKKDQNLNVLRQTCWNGVSKATESHTHNAEWKNHTCIACLGTFTGTQPHVLPFVLLNVEGWIVHTYESTNDILLSKQRGVVVARFSSYIFSKLVYTVSSLTLIKDH